MLKPQRFLAPLALALAVLACTPPPSAQQQLAAAVWAMHREAAPVAAELADAAAAEVVAQERAFAPLGVATLASARTELAGLEAAVAEYSTLVSTSQWTERLLPVLRQAVEHYIALRLLIPSLPPVPQLVLDLLGPCPR